MRNDSTEVYRSTDYFKIYVNDANLARHGMILPNAT
jgi:hypothetical protein